MSIITWPCAVWFILQIYAGNVLNFCTVSISASGVTPHGPEALQKEYLLVSKLNERCLLGRAALCSTYNRLDSGLLVDVPMARVARLWHS